MLLAHGWPAVALDLIARNKTLAANPSQEDWKTAWDLRSDPIYLNHGSFGPSPRSVIEARSQWQAEMESQPMDFFVRRFPDALLATRQRLA